jgi:60S ribosome biogenesis protein Rrp14
VFQRKVLEKMGAPTLPLVPQPSSKTLVEMRKKRTPVASKGDGADGTTTFTANNSPRDLKTLIHKHSLFFDQLVELIPARLFLPYSDDDKPWFLGLFMRLMSLLISHFVRLKLMGKIIRRERRSFQRRRN